MKYRNFSLVRMTENSMLKLLSKLKTLKVSNTKTFRQFCGMTFRELHINSSLVKSYLYQIKLQRKILIRLDKKKPKRLSICDILSKHLLMSKSHSLNAAHNRRTSLAQ